MDGRHGKPDATARAYQELARGPASVHPEMLGLVLNGWPTSLHDLARLEFRALNGLETIHLATGRWGHSSGELNRLSELPGGRGPRDDAIYAINRGKLLRKRGKTEQAGEVLRAGLARAEASLGENSSIEAGLLNARGAVGRRGSTERPGGA